MDRTRRILVLCTGNSARSQMLEALLASRLGDRVEVESAGTEPAAEVNPLAVQALAEIGIDWTGRRPKSVADLADREFDVAVTVCDHAKETCPVLPGAARRLHIGYPDPKEIEEFRDVRDHMRAWLDLFSHAGRPACARASGARRRSRPRGP